MTVSNVFPVVEKVNAVLPPTVPAAVAKRTCPVARFVEVEMPAHVMFGVVPPEENKGADAVTDVTVPVGSAVLQFKSVPEEA